MQIEVFPSSTISIQSFAGLRLREPIFRRGVRHVGTSPAIAILNWDFHPTIVHGSLRRMVLEDPRTPFVVDDLEYDKFDEPVDRGAWALKSWPSQVFPFHEHEEKFQELSHQVKAQVIAEEKAKLVERTIVDFAIPHVVHVSRPLLHTAAVRPWRNVRTASDLVPSIDRPLDASSANPEIHLCRVMASVYPQHSTNVVRGEHDHFDFSKKNSPVISVYGPHPRPTQTPDSIPPSEVNLAAWRKKRTVTTKDGKAHFKNFGIPRFQTQAHDKYLGGYKGFAAILTIKEEQEDGSTAAASVATYEDGLENLNADADSLSLLEANSSTEDAFSIEPEAELLRNRLMLDQRIEVAKARTQALVAAYDRDNKFIDSKLKVVRLRREFGRNKPRLERTATESKNDALVKINKIQTRRMPLLLIPVGEQLTKAMQDTWDDILYLEFEKEFEARNKRDDIEFESWRREARTRTIAELAETYPHEKQKLAIARKLGPVPIPPPSWGREFHAYSPELRNIKVRKGSANGSNDSGFSVETMRAVKARPSKARIEKFINSQPKAKQKQLRMLLETFWVPPAGFKNKNQERAMQKAKERFMNQVVEFERTCGRLFDPQKLSPKDIQQILEHGGSYVVLPGGTKDAYLNLVPVTAEPRTVKQGMLDGLSGRDSDAEILGALEMATKQQARDKVDALGLPKFRRNQKIKMQFTNIAARFASAEVVHFGDPEILRESLRDRIALKQSGEQS